MNGALNTASINGLYNKFYPSVLGPAFFCVIIGYRVMLSITMCRNHRLWHLLAKKIIHDCLRSLLTQDFVVMCMPYIVCVSGYFNHNVPILCQHVDHRYHFPVGGTIKEARIIQGINPTGGQLWWDRENKRYAFNPAAKTGWQSIETRGCIIIETADYGLVALLPIGMAVVGSVNFEPNITPGAAVSKGDMLGHFAFGGSDFIMIFQDGVTFTLDSPKQEDGNMYQHILMGERLGFLSKKD
jgi:hypothetical protein